MIPGYRLSLDLSRFWRVTAVIGLGLALTAQASPVAAIGPVDQDFVGDTSLQAALGHCCSHTAQTFRAGRTGALDQVAVVVGRAASVTDDLVVEIRTVDPARGTPTTIVLASARVSAGLVVGGLLLVPFQTPTIVTAGASYAIVLVVPDHSFWGGWDGQRPGGYATGAQYSSLDGGLSWFVQGDDDLFFRTFVTPIQGPQTARAVTLDGMTGYVTAASANDLNLTHDWTLETWFKDENPLGFNHAYVNLLNKGDREGHPEAPYFLSLGYKRLVAGLRTGWTDYAISYDLRTGGIDSTKWHHAAASFQAITRTLTLYVDGAQVAQELIAATGIGNTLPLQIGRNGDTSGKYFQGRLDDVRIWNVVRSAADIGANYRQELPGVPTGLVANWKFNDQPGLTAVDSAGNHTASLKGGAAFSTDALS